MRFLLFALLFFNFLNAQQLEKAIYVSNNGNDINTGTEKLPFKSLEKAIVYSRTFKNKLIIIKAGVYYNVHIKITAQDSGLTIKGEKNGEVSLLGGVRIKKWKKENHLIYANLEFNPGLDGIRMILINGNLGSRSRIPDIGNLTHNNEWKETWVSTLAGWSKKPSKKELTTLDYKQKDLAGKDLSSAELTVFHQWDESYLDVKNVDTINNRIEFKNEASFPPGAFASWNPRAKQYVIWNTKSGLTKAGQWFYDKAKNRIYYWLKTNEKIENLNLIVPNANHIIEFSKGANHIKFENLQISCANTKLVNEGYATINITGAITGELVNNIEFSDIFVNNVAGWGIKLSGKNIKLDKCNISNVGGSGVYYSGQKIVIERSIFSNLGKIYNGSVGVVGSGKNNEIDHCEFYNIPYAGINNVGSFSVVSNCLFYNIKTFMQDGGAIYSGGDNNVVYKRNAVLGDPLNKQRTIAYYFDELAHDCKAINNLAVNTKNPIHAHMAERIVYNNNFFIDFKEQTISVPESSNIEIDSNIFLTGFFVFKGPDKISLANKIDTTTIRIEMRKYVFANGISSFKNNKMYILKNSDSTINDFKHRIGKEIYNGTVFNSSSLFFNQLIKSDFLSNQTTDNNLNYFLNINFENVGCTYSFSKLYKHFIKQCEF